MKRIIDQKATKERIRELRIQRGYTQEEIADIMGGSRSYYNSMETGNRELNEKYLETLAKIFDVDWDEICIYVEYDYEIWNDGNLYQLKDKAEKFIAQIREEEWESNIWKK